MGNIFKRYIQTNNEKQIINNVNKPNIDKKTSNADDESTTYIGMAKNLAKSLLEWQQAGRPVVNSSQWNKRIKICRGCEFWQEIGESQIARCKKCGCSSAKLLLSTSRCPLNPPKWGAS